MYSDDNFDWRQKAAMLELQGRDLSDLASALAEHAEYNVDDPVYRISRVLRAFGQSRERTAHEVWMTGHQTEQSVRAAERAKRAADQPRYPSVVDPVLKRTDRAAERAYSITDKRDFETRAANRVRSRRWLSRAAVAGALACIAWVWWPSEFSSRAHSGNGIVDHSLSQKEWIAVNPEDGELAPARKPEAREQ